MNINFDANIDQLSVRTKRIQVMKRFEARCQVTSLPIQISPKPFLNDNLEF